VNSASQKAEQVEAALLADIGEEMGQRFNPSRFVPLVVMHEFEALLSATRIGLRWGFEGATLLRSCAVSVWRSQAQRRSTIRLKMPHQRG